MMTATPLHPHGTALQILRQMLTHLHNAPVLRPALAGLIPGLIAGLIAILIAGLLSCAAPGQSTLHAETVVVEGRFVDPTDRAPIQRCRVRLSGHQSTGYALSWGAGDWSSPPEVVTGPDGKFRFEFLLPAATEAPTRARYHIEASHAHRVGWFSHCVFDVVAARGGVDYGDIALPKGVRPRIRCLDTEGQPQAGVRLTVRRRETDNRFLQSELFGPSSWVNHGHVLYTDIDGYLHPDDPFLPGEWTVSVEGRTVAKIPESFELPSAEPVTVVVAAAPAQDIIEGRIVDTEGLPVSGALLAIAGANRGENRTWFRSRRDGRFTVLRPDGAGGETAWIELARNSRYDQWVRVGEVSWGERQAEIVRPADTPVAIEVVAADGSAVKAFNLYCIPADTRGPNLALRRSGIYDHGKIEDELGPGRYFVRVFPRERNLAPSDWEDVEVEDQGLTHRVQLPSVVERTVRVATAGQPVPGALVEVVQGSRPDLFGILEPITAGVDLSDSGRPKVVASGVANERGEAVLHVARGDQPAFARVSGPGIQAQVFAIDWQKPAIDVAVDAGGRLEGQLGPLADVLRLDPTHDPATPERSVYGHQRDYAPRLSIEVGDETPVPWGPPIAVDHLGRFSIPGLPPGRVRLSVQRWTQPTPSSFQPDPTLHPIVEVDVRAGQTERVQLELPAALRR